MKKLLSFVIPCYCSTTTLPLVVKEIIDTITKSKEFDYQIILVNDNSPDETFKVIKNLCLKNSRITGINLSRNFGQHAALLAGYSRANGDYIISIDDDGEIPINEIYKLIDKLNEGYDVVLGKYGKKTHNIFKIISSELTRVMCQVLVGQPKNIYTTSFYISRRFVIKEMLRYKNSYPFIAGLIFRTTQNVANVIVSHRARLEGKSNYTLSKMFKLWFNGFTAFSIIPLRIASVMGSVCAFLGLIFVCKIIINKFTNPDIPLGYSSMMASILFIGGMIMIMLGLIGEYVGRIYISINNNPQYVIKEIVCSKPLKK
ncbi:MAG: glycosyltransferase family 2 protein [Spirochaetes bacterium]|jgi:undecaprenyl-phosphate 4-deoxy-4-formamido-L-arabinose transferase|nr:glycosyltransferase family 2 protein [Spirochaetota bacterium]